jgi:hypothetical protein
MALEQDLNRNEGKAEEVVNKDALPPADTVTGQDTTDGENNLTQSPPNLVPATLSTEALASESVMLADTPNHPASDFGEFIRAAFDASGLEPAAWNDLNDEDRDALIAAAAEPKAAA